MAQAELARAELEAGHWENERSGALAMHMHDNPLAMDRGVSAAQVRGGHQAAVTCQLQLVRGSVPASQGGQSPPSIPHAAALDETTSCFGLSPQSLEVICS